MPFLNLKFKNKNLKFNSGFTLIELLVVISIIGILAALATFSYTDSQRKARDTKRKSDLIAIQKALELAKQDSAGNYSYPNCYLSGIITASCTVSADNTIKSGSTALAPTYIKAVPKDPKTGLGYTYSTFLSDGTSTCQTAATCVTFSLITCLENTKDPQKDNPINAAGNCTTGASYTITNL